MKRGISILIFSVLSFCASGQVVLSTSSGSGYTGGGQISGRSAVTFNIQNNGPNTHVLNEVSTFVVASMDQAVYELWVTTVDISGVVALDDPIWQKVAVSDPVAVSGTGIQPVFDSVGFLIPPATHYRFALVGSEGLRVSLASTNPAPSAFAASGVSLFTGNHQIGGSSVGYGGNPPLIVIQPRWFTGGVRLDALPTCQAGIIPAIRNLAPPSICSGDFAFLTIKPHSGLVQWQESLDGILWQNIAGSQGFALSRQLNTTTMFRALITCGSQTDTTLPTSQHVASGPLAAGSYTLNRNLPASAANFQSFQALASTLNCSGISGPVTISVAPGSGPYSERFILDEIQGSGPNARVTILGNGNTIQYAPTGPSTLPAVLLNGTDYLTIDSLHVEITDPNRGVCYQLRNQANHNIIRNCQLTMNIQSSNFRLVGIAQSSETDHPNFLGNTGNFNRYEGNQITGGFWSILINGLNNANPTDGILIINNRVSDFYSMGLLMQYNINFEVKGNHFSAPNRTVMGNEVRAMSFTQNSRGANIEGNLVHNIGQSLSNNPTVIGINTAVGFGGTTGNFSFIQNNVITNIKTNNSIYGISLRNNANFIRCYHNTIAFDHQPQNSGSDQASFHIVGSSSQIHFVNNISYMEHQSLTGATQAGIYFQGISVSASFTSNHNAFFHTSPIAAVGRERNVLYNSLQDWQQFSNRDLSSVFFDPFFIDLQQLDFTPSAQQLNGIGTNVGVLADFFGNPRSGTNPDPGAVEFVPATSDLALSSMTPVRSGCLSNQDSLEWTITEVFGGGIQLAQQPVSFSWQVTGPVPSTGTVILNQDSILPFGQKSFQVGPIDFSIPGTYFVTGYLSPSANNPNRSNDTLGPISVRIAAPNLTATPHLDTVVISTTQKHRLGAWSNTLPDPQIYISEMCHIKTAPGAPIDGWPSYLQAVNYIELSGPPGLDLEGYVLEQWRSTLDGTHTFGPGTVFSPEGTMILAVGNLQGSVERPEHYYYHANGTFGGGYASQTPVGRILKRPDGSIVDAVGHAIYNFPIQANVPPSEWSQPNTMSTFGLSGMRLIGPDMNTGANWVVADGVSHFQDPATLNHPELLDAFSMPNLSWWLNGQQVSDSTSFLVGPFLNNAVLNYEVRLNTPCGILTDTATLVVVGDSLCMTGNYTLNDNLPTQGRNFQSLSDVFVNMETYGVCGAVTIDATPGTGPYFGPLTLKSYTGLGPNATVTLNGNGVRLESQLTGANDTGFTLILDGAHHFVFDHWVVVKDENAQGGTLQLKNQANWNIFKNCHFLASTTGTPNTRLNVVIGNQRGTGNYIFDALAGSDNLFEDNLIEGGYYGMLINGGPNAEAGQSNQIIKNEFQDFYAYGISARNQRNLEISGNSLSRAGRVGGIILYGIHLFGQQTGAQVKGNWFFAASASPLSVIPVYGLGIQNAVATPDSPAVFANNIIHNLQTIGSQYSIYGTGASSNIRFLHNTLVIDNPQQSGSSNAANVYLTGAAQGIQFENNIFYIASSAGGVQSNLWFADTLVSISSRNNVFFNPGPNAFVSRRGQNTYPTLAAWQQLNQDSNSVWANPVFSSSVGVTSATPLNALIDNIGTPVGILEDFLGQQRSLSTPDPGAIEFSGVTSDLAIFRANYEPKKCLLSQDTVWIGIKNILGTTADFTQNAQAITWEITGPISSTGTATISSGQLGLGDTLNFPITGLNFSIAGAYQFTAALVPGPINQSAVNDTLADFPIGILGPIHHHDIRHDTLQNQTDSVEVTLISEFVPLPRFFFSEICHFKTTTGAPAGGWPSYLGAGNYVEITGEPNADLSGITLEQWSTTALLSSYTFPKGTILSPNGTAIIGVGTLTGSPSPANFYYFGTGGTPVGVGSGNSMGRILRDSLGRIVDAVAYTAVVYSFPPAAGVSPADWSQPIIGGSGTSGIRLLGIDDNTGNNWVVTSATHQQDPGLVNPQVIVPVPTGISGLVWTLNGDTLAIGSQAVWVTGQQFTGPQFLVSYMHTPCGLLTDTTLIYVNIFCMAPSAFNFLNVDISTATINWTSALNAQGYVVSYGPPGFHPETVTPLGLLDFNLGMRFGGKGSILATPIGFSNETFGSGLGSSDPNTGNNQAWTFSGFPPQGTGNLTTGIELQMSTVGTSQIQLSFDQKLSANAPAHWTVQYTTDYFAANPNWTTLNTYQATSSGIFNTRSFSFSGITDLENNPAAGFRVVASFGASGTGFSPVGATAVYSPAAIADFDMILVEGQSIGNSGWTQHTTMTTETIDSLSPATPYDVFVRSYCGSGFSAWAGPFGFTTDPLPNVRPFNLHAPVDSTLLAIVGLPSTIQIFNWHSAGDSALYLWELLHPVTGLPIAQFPSDNAGQDTLFSISFGRLDSLLQAQGALPGDTSTYFWQVTATSGMDTALSLQPFAIFLLRTGITGPCAPASGLTAVVTCDEVTTSWVQGSNAQQTLLEYGLSGFTLGSGTSATSSGNTYIIPISGFIPGTQYDVYVRSACPFGLLANWIGPVQFNIPDVPLASFSTSLNQANINGVTYDFDASATQNATQFSWSFGDGNFGTGSFTTHTYVSNGTYQARLYASTPCVTDTATATIVIHQISLDEPHSRPGLRIFPNPTKNLLAIEGAGLSAISIFGATGVLLFETTNAIESNLTTIDVSTWPAGVYYLHANVQGSIQVRSFVIVR